MTDTPCILVVEDDFLIADLFADMVTEMGFRVCGIADTADDAVEMARLHSPCAILMDVRLKGSRDGIHAALEIRQGQSCPVIFITGSQEAVTVARINEDHPAAILFKPVDFERLKQTVRDVVA